MWWDTVNNIIHNAVDLNCAVATLGSFNSFCDIPIPNPSNFPGDQFDSITPVVYNAYTFNCPAAAGTNMFLTIWVSDDSFLTGGLLVFDYQYFYGTPGLFRRSVETRQQSQDTYSVPPCYPVIDKISPGFAYTSGSVIFLEGDHFGVNADLININVGTFPCTQTEMIISDSLIRCIVVGTGTNLAVNITVGSTNTIPPYQLLSFSGACPLICSAGSYPDQGCTTCVTPQSSTDAVGTSRLSDVVSSISSDLVEATYFSDITFMQTANFYKGNPVMEILSIPRYTVPDVTVDMKFAIAATSPLQVTALTNLLQGYDATVIPSLELHYESQSASWTKIDNNGTITYRLDIV